MWEIDELDHKVSEKQWENEMLRSMKAWGDESIIGEINEEMNEEIFIFLFNIWNLKFDICIWYLKFDEGLIDWSKIDDRQGNEINKH
jgi:hypothetical protein